LHLKLAINAYLEIAMNPFGYCVLAGAVIKHYTSANNRATPARYDISDHIFNLHILQSGHFSFWKNDDLGR
jgi:hypothetical protein